MNEEHLKPQGLLNWFQESVTVKLVFISILSVLLLIPSAMIQSLITERSGRQTEIEKDVADKWSASQLVQGPVLVIPYKKQYKERDASNREIIKDVVENLYILPENLHIKSGITPQVLHRGIFEIVVYSTQVKVWGNFMPELNKLSIQPEQLLWANAKLTFSISDLKGLKTNPVIRSGDQSLMVEPVFNEKGLFRNGLQADINLSSVKNKPVTFDFMLDLKGSDELSFLHTGKTTDVEVNGAWKTPSFSGRYLPDYRKIDEKGFSAKWRILYFNRPFSQQWAANDTLLNNMRAHEDAIFGVKLKLPVDQYQKTMRTSKYSLLIILLTFISLFLTELITRKKIHVFNYILIGVAMVIYYILLLSFSEQLGYNPAYLIASAATMALVSIFIASLLKNKLATLLLAAILTVFYVFVFVLIQLEDMALLIGSIALFIIVSGLMFFSRKINWDKH